MGMVFFEKMRGDVRDRWGKRHALDFDLRVESASARHLLSTGVARLTGVVHAPPWADHAAVEGTLTFAASHSRTLSYDLNFHGDDGAAMSLRGTKQFRWLAPVASLTQLAAELRAGDELLARGEIRFDLNEAVALVRSLAPANTVSKFAAHLPAAGVEVVDALTAAETAHVRALAAAVILPGQRVPPADEKTVKLACDLLARFPAEGRLAWRAALATVAAGVRVETGSAMDDLPAEDLRALLLRWTAPEDLHTLHRAAEFVVMPVRTGHFQHPDYLAAIGFPKMSRSVAEPKPRFLSAVTSAEELDADTTIEAEVVVVGTGAGGAAIAAALAERGVVVAVVEEGRYKTRHDFTGDPVARMSSLYREQGMTFTVGNPPIAVPLGKVVGGTTTINSGTCLRPGDEVVADWQARLGLGEQASKAAMAPWYDKVERELGVAPGDPRYLGGVADVVACGADAMGLKHGPLPRNAPGCDGQGTCIFGCPTAAKRSTDVSWMPRAIRAGARVYCGLPVRRILMRGRRAVGVLVRGTDAFGATKTLTIRAESVVISCGALLSPLLLADSGVRLPWLGKNLSLHPAMGMMALPEPGAGPQSRAPWDCVPQGYGAHGAGDGIVFEGVYVPPQLIAGTMPLIAGELTRWMDAQPTAMQYGFMTRDVGNGRVFRSPTGGRVAAYGLSDDSHRQLQKGAALLAEMLLRGGASEVMTGIARMPTVSTVEDARAIATADIRKADWKLLGAHPLGTCRMGTDAATAVVDSDHKVFGTANLYVVDGSSVPTSLGANPQLTIMAMALRAGERLADGPIRCDLAPIKATRRAFG